MVFTAKRNASNTQNDDALRQAEMRQLTATNQRLTEQMELAVARLNQASSAALSDNTRKLHADNLQQLDLLLKPLQTQIEIFDKSVRDAYINENATRLALRQQIDSLMTLNENLGKEAQNLTAALRGNSKVQGDWGETMLVSLLEKAGLKQGVNFETQMASENGYSIRDEENRLQRPDVVLNLPDGVRLIIDSKVSLTAYMDFCSATETEDIKTAGQRHVQSVKKHIEELARKKYQDNLNGCVPQVLMFIPNDGAYCAAMQLQPELHAYASSKRVCIVSPTHLFSVVQLVAQLWQRENQNRNAEQIAKLAGLLLDKIVDFTNELDKIQLQIDNAETALATARKHLTQGSTSVISRARRLQEMGAKTTKTLKQSWIDESTETPHNDLSL